MNITFSKERIANFVLGQKPINESSLIFVNNIVSDWASVFYIVSGDVVIFLNWDVISGVF